MKLPKVALDHGRIDGRVWVGSERQGTDERIAGLHGRPVAQEDAVAPGLVPGRPRIFTAN
jgi:hypothetical protein